MQTLSESAVLDQLDRLLQAETMQRSPRLQQLLRHIVERTLAGREADLKGTVIAHEVFDRSESFDPKTDALVRVNATRLRRVIESYYHKEGRLDAVEIRLDPGSYVPRFLPRDQTPPVYAGTERSWLPWAITSGAVIASIVWVVWSQLKTPEADLSETVAEVVQATGEGPILIIERQAGASGSAQLDNAFAEMLAQDLVRFRSLQVRLGDTAFRPGDRPADAYRLLASVTRDKDGYTFAVRIHDPVGQLLWAHQVSRPPAADTYAAVTAEVAAVVAARVGQPFGVINAAETRRAQNAPRLGAGPYLCVLSFYDYQRLRSEATHRAARTCLMQAVGSAPRYSDAWAALSLTILDEERFGFNRQANAVGRASAAAERALTLDPENALAHRAAAIAAFASGQIRAFEIGARQALEANPNAPDTLAEIGSYLIFAGKFEDGSALLKHAMSLSPGHPNWYYMALAIAALHDKRPEEAVLDAASARDPRQALSLWIEAGALAAVGRAGEAGQTLEQIGRLEPGFAQDPAAPAKRWGIVPEVSALVIDPLVGAGLVKAAKPDAGPPDADRDTAPDAASAEPPTPAAG